jgi:hypothetical protein
MISYKHLRTNCDLRRHELLHRMKIEFLILTYLKTDQPKLK